MTPEQALTLLKDAYLDDEHATIRSLNIADYHALLSLLEGMRWKPIQDNRPLRGERIIYHEAGSLYVVVWDALAAATFWNGEWIYAGHILPTPPGDDA